MILANINSFCNEAAPLLQFVGYLVLIFKIAIPVVIIVLGMMDFGKAVVSEKDEDIKKQAIKLGRRALAGIVIFFIPVFIKWLFYTAGLVSGTSGKNSACVECVLDVSGQACSDAINNKNNQDN